MNLELDKMNKSLDDKYGRIENLPNYRVVWSEGLLEKRLVSYTKDGFQLLYPEIREVPKYGQWIQNKYILERLAIVPEINKNELTTPLSYEPLWVFEDKFGNSIQPSLGACYFVIEQVIRNMSGEVEHYKDPDAGLTKEQWLEKKRNELTELEQALYGNETDTGDALAYHEGIVVPSNYKKVEIN